MLNRFIVCLVSFLILIPAVVFSQETSSNADLSTFEKLFGKGPQEEDFFRAERLLVSATGSQIPVHLAPSVASVITKEDIEKIGATTLDEILETVPGLHVVPSTTTNLSSIWSIRGIHTSVNPQTLLLVNGIPFNNIHTGSRPYGLRIPASIISRVEVVRGPGSAVHGADAFSGTVNVITKDNFEIDGTQAGLRYGSFDSSDIWLQHGGQYLGWDVYGSVSTQKSKGDNNRVVDQDFPSIFAGGALSAYSNTPAHFDTEYDWVTTHFGLRKDNFHFRFYGSWNENLGMGPGGIQTVTYNGGMDGRNFIADLEYNDKDFSKDLDLKVRLYYFYNYGNLLFEFFPPQIQGKAVNIGPVTYDYWLGNPIVTNKQTGLENTLIYDGFNDHKVRFSFGWQFTDSDTDQFKNYGPAVAVQFGPLVNIKNTPYNFREDKSRKVWNVSLQDEWSFINDWTLTAGVRYDYYDDFGSTTNPRAALVWETLYNLTSKLMYGRAYRAPSFTDQYLQNNSQAWGNPDLEPETIDTYELAFDYQPTSTLGTKLSFFSYSIDGLIEYVAHPTLANNLQAQNNKNQKGHGVEIEMDWEVIKDFKIISSFAYQRSKDKDTNEIVAETPEKQFYLNPHWNFMPEWSVDSQVYWIAGRHRANGDPRGDIDDYELVNLTLRRKNIAKYFDIAVAVRNLFNEDIREPSAYAAGAGSAGAFIPNDYPMESRAIWAEIKCKL